MFAYCRNNPVCRIDISGRKDMECTDIDGNPSIDEEDIVGGSSSTGAGAPAGTSTSSGGGNSGGSQAYAGQPSPPAPGGGNATVDGNPNGAKTEVHHIVEQCQATKSGFSRVSIDGARNKVRIPQSVHRKISGHYSSKTEQSGDLRVRDWLAGKSFAEQYEYGLKILEQMWKEVFG